MSEGDAESREFAGLGRRIGAYILDSLLIGVITAILGIVLVNVASPETGGMITQVFLLAGTFGYFIYFEGNSGQTPGKSVLNIAVEKEDGSSMDYKTSTIRNVLRIVDSLFMYLVGIIAILLTGDKQRVGDIFANTVVVRRK